MSLWPACVAKAFVCEASEQLPVHRNALPTAYESKSFQMNDVSSIIFYSCLLYMSSTFSPLTNSFPFMGKSYTTVSALEH